MNENHLWTLFNDAHWRSLDNICSHPLEAQEIEDLAEGLGLEIMADQLRENRREQERRVENSLNSCEQSRCTQLKRPVHSQCVLISLAFIILPHLQS